MRAGRFVSPQRDPSTGRFTRDSSGDEVTGLAAPAAAVAASAAHGAPALPAGDTDRKPPVPDVAAAASPPDASADLVPATQAATLAAPPPPAGWGVVARCPACTNSHVEKTTTG